MLIMGPTGGVALERLGGFSSVERIETGLAAAWKKSRARGGRGAPDAATALRRARELARRITVTTRRDAGLLMNPNYQRAEFVSVLPL